jgi:hypothetical protein
MKYILVTLLCVCNYIGYSQVYKFRAFQTAIIDINNNDTLKWNDADILVVINLDKSKIQIYAKHPVDIDIISAGKGSKDDDGNAWGTYDAVDEEGAKCLVQWEVFKDQSGRHNSTLFIIYKDGRLIYRLKKPED